MSLQGFRTYVGQPPRELNKVSFDNSKLCFRPPWWLRLLSVLRVVSVVVDLLFIVAPLVCWVFVCNAALSILSSNHLAEEKTSGCFTSIVSLLLVFCLSLVVPWVGLCLWHFLVILTCFWIAFYVLFFSKDYAFQKHILGIPSDCQKV